MTYILDKNVSNDQNNVPSPNDPSKSSPMYAGGEQNPNDPDFEKDQPHAVNEDNSDVDLESNADTKNK